MITNVLPRFYEAQCRTIVVVLWGCH